MESKAFLFSRTQSLSFERKKMESKLPVQWKFHLAEVLIGTKGGTAYQPLTCSVLYQSGLGYPHPGPGNGPRLQIWRWRSCTARRYGVRQISVRYRRPGQTEVPPRACIRSRGGPHAYIRSSDGLRHDWGAVYRPSGGSVLPIPHL